MWRSCVLIALLLLGGCASVPIGAVINPRSIPSVTDRNSAQVPVWYATDRSYSGETGPSGRFGADRDRLRFGWCLVSVPREHRMGKMETPSIWRFEFHEDPVKHWVVQRTQPTSEAQFRRGIQQWAGASRRKEVFLFVHGFRVTFDEAAKRAAQVSYDLGFDGVTVLFSWPSAGEAAGYGADYDSAAWSTPDLLRTVKLLAADPAINRIHIVAHSMGSVAVTAALDQLAHDPDGSVARAKLQEVVLAAADVDADILRRLIVNIRQTAQRITLYASRNDEALKLSETLRGGRPRAGDANPIFVAEGIETIDASLVDTSFVGHSYYGDNRSVLSDIFYLLRDHLPASQRFGLTRTISGGTPYWIFVPGH